MNFFVIDKDIKIRVTPDRIVKAFELFLFQKVACRDLAHRFFDEQSIPAEQEDTVAFGKMIFLFPLFQPVNLHVIIDAFCQGACSTAGIVFYKTYHLRLLGTIFKA